MGLLRNNFVLFFAAVMIVSSGNARAEDAVYQNYYGQNYEQQKRETYYNDYGYDVPSSYDGRYYPSETESATGYRGLDKTSSYTTNEAYYFYYY